MPESLSAFISASFDTSVIIVRTVATVRDGGTLALVTALDISVGVWPVRRPSVTASKRFFETL